MPNHNYSYYSVDKRLISRHKQPLIMRNKSIPGSYFSSPVNIRHKQYEALRAFFIDEMPACDVANAFAYTTTAFYSLVRDFRKQLVKDDQDADMFFHTQKTGRKKIDQTGSIENLIISLRKKYLSVSDIKAVLDVHGCRVSERYVYNVIKCDGFDRLPRRNGGARKQAASLVKMEAPVSAMLDFRPEKFLSQNSLAILCLLPYLQKYGILQLIEQSLYPQTKTINRVSSILSFLALKLSNVRRYTADDAWCMDRGLGLFAGLNVLPKAAWLSSYSHRITRKMNLDFLKSLHNIWLDAGVLSDTANLDFTTIPYWGNDSHLENNWSGKRNKALSSMLAILAQDPDSGIITYSDTNIRHDKQSQVVLEFLDFYQSNGKSDLRYLVFDSKLTTYENLKRLDPDIKFLTIRRRGKKVVDELNKLPATEWKRIRVQTGDGKGRYVKVNDTSVLLPGYGGNIRQIAITGHGKIKPALIITNDFDCPCEQLVRKYARRWLVEKAISEQIEFFHLNKVSSSMVIKVDFDLTMSVFANNVLKLLAMDIPGFKHNVAMTLYNKFLQNSGSVRINDSSVIVKLKKKRNLPALLTAMESLQNLPVSCLGNRNLIIDAETFS